MLKATVIRAPSATRLEDELNAFFHQKGVDHDRLVDLKVTALNLNKEAGARRTREYLAVLLYRE